ncbi:MAG: Fic family protein [Treponema sp.]
MNDNKNMEKSSFELDFDSYILQSEPSKQEKGRLWKTAIGLQQVDQLKPSKYLYDLAKKNIDGEITISEVKTLIDTYYESKTARPEQDDGTEEADKVSANMTAMLAEKAFNFSTAYFCKIHERLFKCVFDKIPVGKFRNYNITKREWVLDGDTVYYSDWELIPQTLDYDFNAERDFDYSTLSKDDVVRHITRFIANIWQVHAFGEGNTRTTAVFAIKYLRALGFDAANKPFGENSWYFRNALVRANYTNVQKGVYMNAEYLEKFFRNLMLGEKNEIKNRLCHIRYGDGSQKVTAKVTQKVTVKLSNNQNKILEEIKKNPFITQYELSELIGITRKAIIQNMKKLQDAGLIERVGSDKSGKWAMGDDTFISP